jgi:hypothetical protein
MMAPLCKEYHRHHPDGCDWGELFVHFARASALASSYPTLRPGRHPSGHALARLGLFPAIAESKAACPAIADGYDRRRGGAKMPLGLESQIEQCLKEGRRSEGLQLRRLESLLRAAGEGPSPFWAEFAQARFTKVLCEKLNLSAAEGLLAYMRTVSKRLDGINKIAVDHALNLDASTNVASKLGVRQEQAARKTNITSVTTYRMNIEGPALKEFARLLNSPTNADIISLGLDPISFQKFIEDHDHASPSATAKIVVLGGAVMDLNFVIPHMPDFGESVQALRFAAHPGGKGLTQAVACARLGLETKLI